MVAQNVPGEDVGLSAGQARHDGLEIAFHDPRLSIPCQGALVQAVRRPGLHHHEGGGDRWGTGWWKYPITAPAKLPTPACTNT